MYWKLMHRPAFTDGVVDLYPVNLGEPEESLEFGDYRDYIITEHGKKREAGQISLRFGESTGVYYFGHIGYHVDPPFRGHHYAERACRLVLPVFRAMGMRSLVITCDPDNIGSNKTCRHLGCLAESRIPVPEGLQKKWLLSPEKRRYILLLEEKG